MASKKTLRNRQESLRSCYQQLIAAKTLIGSMRGEVGTLATLHHNITAVLLKKHKELELEVVEQRTLIASDHKAINAAVIEKEAALRRAQVAEDRVLTSDQRFSLLASQLSLSEKKVALSESKAEQQSKKADEWERRHDALVTAIRELEERCESLSNQASQGTKQLEQLRDDKLQLSQIKSRLECQLQQLTVKSVQEIGELTVRKAESEAACEKWRLLAEELLANAATVTAATEEKNEVASR